MMKTRFNCGDTVRVLVDDPPRHIRTPAYIQGKTGRIETVHGAFANPETLAHGGDGLPLQALYLVGFDPAHVWEARETVSGERLLIDLYEHWLEPEE
jgi:nitrile hydratase subunit beta